MKANTMTWAILVLLSAVSFSIAGASASAPILAAAGVKAAFVGWQFMELRTAHRAWAAALLTFLAALLGLIHLLGPS